MNNSPTPSREINRGKSLRRVVSTGVKSPVRPSKQADPPEDTNSLTVEQAVAAALRAVRTAAPAPRTCTVPLSRLPSLIESWTLDATGVGGFSPRYISEINDVWGKFLWWCDRAGETEFCTDSVRRFFVYLRTAHTRPEGRWGEMGQTRADHEGKSGHSPAKRYAPLSPTRIKDYHKHLTTLANFLVRQHVVDISPMAGVAETVARDSGISFDVFTIDEIGRILRAASRSRYPVRDVALCLFLLDTGVRAGECCGLVWGEMDLVNRRVDIRQETAKGGKQRTVFWSPETNKALWAWIQEKGQEPSAPVFPCRNGGNVGGPLTRSGLLSLITKIGKAAKVPHCHPHTFRHTFATRSLLAGMDQITLMELMGHNDLAMTRRYVRFTGVDLANQARRFSVVDNLRKGK